MEVFVPNSFMGFVPNLFLSNISMGWGYIKINPTPQSAADQLTYVSLLDILYPNYFDIDPDNEKLQINRLTTSENYFLSIEELSSKMCLEGKIPSVI